MIELKPRCDARGKGFSPVLTLVPSPHDRLAIVSVSIPSQAVRQQTKARCIGRSVARRCLLAYFMSGSHQANDSA